MATPTVTNLVAGFQARRSAKKVRQLTNPGDADATSLNTTLLNQAAVDAALRFEEFTAKLYDDTNVSHVEMCCVGVEAVLLSYENAVAPYTEAMMANFENKAKEFFRRNKQRFRTNMPTTKTTPRTRTHYFREGEFDDIRPDGNGTLGDDP